MELGELLQAITARDVVDVVAVSFIFYFLLRLIRGTRAVQALVGIVMLVTLAFGARAFQLQTLEDVLDGVLINALRYGQVDRCRGMERGAVA